MTAVLPVDETRLAHAELDAIRAEIDENPDQERDLTELRALHGKLKPQIALQMELLQAWSAPPEKLSNGKLDSLKDGELVQRLLYHALDTQLHRSVGGKSSWHDKGIRLFASPAYSGVDMLGGDFLLVDSSTGNVLLLDATARCDKNDLGLPKLRKIGLIANISLAHDARSFGLDDAEFGLAQRLEKRLPKLIEDLRKSPLNVLDLRLPLTRPVGNVNERIQELKECFDRSKADDLMAELATLAGRLNDFCVDLEARAELFRDLAEVELLTEFVVHLRARHEGKCISGALSFVLGAIERLSKICQRQSRSSFETRQDARRTRIRRLMEEQAEGTDGLPPNSHN